MISRWTKCVRWTMFFVWFLMYLCGAVIGWYLLYVVPLNIGLLFTIYNSINSNIEHCERWCSSDNIDDLLGSQTVDAKCLMGFQLIWNCRMQEMEMLYN